MVRILVVEDDPDLLRLYSILLQRFGVEAVSASNGLEALKALDENPDVAAVITDAMMPGLDGVSLTTLVHQWYGDVPIIVVTSYPGPGRQALAHGATRFIHKPIPLADLMLIVRDLL